jgi:hypothetical protein
MGISISIVYTWYMPYIYRRRTYTWNIHSIYWLYSIDLVGVPDVGQYDNSTFVLLGSTYQYVLVHTSGTPIFGIYHACTWCIPCTCTCPTYTWNIHCLSMHIHKIGYTWKWISMVYSWIYHVYPHSIYMVYHLMYIHGIYVVYPWIFLDIPSFMKSDFAAGSCCWSHSMLTRVCVIKS